MVSVQNCAGEVTLRPIFQGMNAHSIGGDRYCQEPQKLSITESRGWLYR